MQGGEVFATVEDWDKEYFKKNGYFKFLTPEDVSSRKEIFKVSYTGFGWLLVKKGVFESLDYPWVQPTWFDEDGIREMTTTDCGFMHRAAEKGHHTYIDPLNRDEGPHPDRREGRRAGHHSGSYRGG